MKTGYIVDNLELSQMHLELLQSNNNHFIFTKELTKSFIDIVPAVMDITEIWNFNDGRLIATSIDTGLFMQSSINNSQKILYLYDYQEMLERGDGMRVCSLLGNKFIDIAVRTEFQALRFEKQFNRKAKYVWENFNECIRTEEQDISN